MVKPKPGEVWLLVTSAIHMPRAMAIARKLDWPMTALAQRLLDRAGRQAILFEFAGNLGLTDYAVHEWIGLLAYRLSGKAA